MERAEALITNGDISQTAVDSRREAYLAAQGALEQPRAALELAQLDLEYTDITVQHSGRIDQTHIDPGNLILFDQTQLMSIVSYDPIYFIFDIDERYFLAYAGDAHARGAS